jgi:hypothetical protein
LIYLIPLSLDRREFLRRFRGFAASAPTVPLAQRRIFRRLQTVAAARLICAFVVVRRSLARTRKFWQASRPENMR